MAPRKNTTTTRTPSKRKDTSKSEIGSVAPADAVGFGSNGHPTMAPASEASIRAQIEFRAYEVFLARGGAHGDDHGRLVQGRKGIKCTSSYTSFTAALT
jgi:hypothetical protein